jgi:hypothetical protein
MTTERLDSAIRWMLSNTPAALDGHQVLPDDVRTERRAAAGSSPKPTVSWPV